VITHTVAATDASKLALDGTKTPDSSQHNFTVQDHQNNTSPAIRPCPCGDPATRLGARAAAAGGGHSPTVSCGRRSAAAGGGVCESAAD